MRHQNENWNWNASGGKTVDKLLAERIAAGKSANQICKEIGIGKQTFYSWIEDYRLKR